MPNTTHKHKHCYPEIVDGVLQSKDMPLHNPSDVQHTCMCTMSELCKELTRMTDDRSRNSIIKFIHNASTEQKDLSF